jgi:transcriptional regulator with XRE-family HTH domain
MSVVSRIERGQHPTSLETLRRLAEALEGRAVFGCEFDGADGPVLGGCN